MSESKIDEDSQEEGGICQEVEMTEPVDLCDAHGRLLQSSVGWSRHPLHQCNLKGHWGRKKKWNYWCLTNDKYLFSVTMSSVDYLALPFAYFLELETKRFVEKNIIVPFARSCNMPDNVGDDIIFKNKAVDLSFKEDKERTRIHVQIPKFGETTLSAELLVEKPEGHETLNVVIPWSQEKFHFTSKQVCLPATGTVKLGEEVFLFEPGRTFACLDFGRGIWRYSSFWNWAFCSGIQNGHTIGFNLGAVWTEGTGVTENAICVDSRISKISEDVVFSYDENNLMEPWTIKTESSKRINIKFVPFYKRAAKTNLLILKSEFFQLFGKFSGTIIYDNGEIINIENLIGGAEEHRARW